MHMGSESYSRTRTRQPYSLLCRCLKTPKELVSQITVKPASSEGVDVKWVDAGGASDGKLHG